MQQKRKFKTKRAAQAEQLNERTGKIRQNAIRSNPSSERCKQDKSSRLFLKTPFPRHTFADNFPDVHNRQRRARLGRVIAARLVWSQKCGNVPQKSIPPEKGRSSASLFVTRPCSRRRCPCRDMSQRSRRSFLCGIPKNSRRPA